MRVEDKVCIVTGGARGIGKSIVDTLAAEGAKIVISCDMIEAEHTQTNVRHEKLNVTDREAVKGLISKINDEFGRIDVLVNNAGINRDAIMVKMTEDQWDAVIDVNLKGVFNMTQAVAPCMIKNRKGSIVSLSSVVGLFGNIGQTNYAATKGGVISMTKTWAKELARKGAQVRANCVAPGFIKTPMTENLPEKVIDAMNAKTPLGRIGESEEIAKVVMFLASDDSSYITGETIAVTGGLVI
ncbi:MAG TPA: 3-oxoacyl-[acyl-carrier-protein] reductase [Victivallales bacterium]|nr:3-oxoacyl-[acyl-carrier-protein] reductase [Victivallales bacterium]